GREEEEREEEEEEAIGGRWRGECYLVILEKSGEEGSVGAADVDEEGPLYAQEGEEAARWSSFLNNFCKRIRVWTATRDALTQYRDVLIGRLEEMRKVDRLRRENAELRFLLQGVVNDL
ncbi:putative Sperm tail C-terminal domain-containing protein, partial [Homarus americanus]